MKTVLSMLAVVALAGCNQGEATRCNPLRATPDCDPGFACVFPATPTCNPSPPSTSCCGVSFCCKVDTNGNITDPSPSCQPDPASEQACGFDLSAPLDATPLDSGATD
jgi:hypothetical protein